MLTRFDPFAEFARFNRAFDGGVAKAAGDTFSPAVDIVEEGDHFLVHTELPGVKADAVQIEVEDGLLSIKGERKFEKKQGEGTRYQRVERSYGSFERRFTLPDHVDTEAIEASMVDGVLELKLPKKAEVAPKKITVKAA